MTTLKAITPALDDTPLSNASFWNQPVAAIHPSQMMAFRARYDLEGRAHEADALLDALLTALTEAVREGRIGQVPALGYRPPFDYILTAGALRRGLDKLTRPRPAAIVFGLETGLDSIEVSSLTWEKVRAVALTPRTRRILELQPRYLTANYVFWSGRGRPLFGLDRDVFDLFGLVWGELATAYRRIVMIDEEQEMKFLESAFESLVG